MIVLGVDPGSATTGYGVVRGGATSEPALLECGVVRTSAALDLPGRLLAIYKGIADVCERFNPDCMVVEKAFFGRNVHTTLVLGHARGVILLAAQLQGVEIFEYTPATIKKAIVGTGAADKKQVQYMVTQILRLKEAPQPHDASDAVAAALAHLNGQRVNELVAQHNRGATSDETPSPALARLAALEAAAMSYRPSNKRR